MFLAQDFAQVEAGELHDVRHSSRPVNDLPRSFYHHREKNS
jgi:hypothetical protein